MSNELKTTTKDQFTRGDRVLLEKEPVNGEPSWCVPNYTFNQMELAGIAYFALRELTPLLLVVFADHGEAASGSTIQRVQDSLSWIAEELGQTPHRYQEGLTDAQKEEVKGAFQSEEEYMQGKASSQIRRAFTRIAEEAKEKKMHEFDVDLQTGKVISQE